MLLRLSILCLFVLLGFSAKAQDTLYQKNGSKLVIKVIEVGETNVKYKRYSNLDGPVYTVAKQDITKITYPNGDVDVFMPVPQSSSSANTQRPDPTGITSDFPHLISLNTFDLILGIITLQFETNLRDGYSSIRVPVSTGINSFSTGSTNTRYTDFYYYNRSKGFSTGFDFRYFPRGTGHSGVYVGPSLCYGFVNVRYSYGYQTISYTDHFSGLGIAFGYQFYTTPHLNFTLGATAGMQTNWQASNSNYNYRPLARMDVSVGWRFGAPRVVKKK